MTVLSVYRLLGVYADLEAVLNPSTRSELAEQGASVGTAPLARRLGRIVEDKEALGRLQLALGALGSAMQELRQENVTLGGK